MEEKRTTVGKMILATLAFWAILLLGPFALALWNAISFYRIAQGTVTFLLFSLCAQAVSALAACYVVSALCDKTSRLPMVNELIAAVLIAILCLFSTTSWVEIVSDLAAIAVLAVFAVSSAKGIAKQGSKKSDQE